VAKERRKERFKSGWGKSGDSGKDGNRVLSLGRTLLERGSWKPQTVCTKKREDPSNEGHE